MAYPPFGMALTLKLSVPVSDNWRSCSELRRLSGTAPAQLRCRAERQRRAVSVTRAAIQTQTLIKETLNLEEFEAMMREQPATLVDFYATW